MAKGTRVWSLMRAMIERMQSLATTRALFSSWFDVSGGGYCSEDRRRFLTSISTAVSNQPQGMDSERSDNIWAGDDDQESVKKARGAIWYSPSRISASIC